MVKIYTKTGDDGNTSLFGGERVRKDAARIEAYGTVDELNSVAGFAAAACTHDDISAMLREVQNALFVLGADLATPLSEDKVQVPRIGEQHVQALEMAIDTMEEKLEPIRFFILPGGSELGARIHLCRAVCRRAERSTVELAALETLNDHDVRYLNRLSDFFFVLARYANLSDGAPEIRWEQ